MDKVLVRLTRKTVKGVKPGGLIELKLREAKWFEKARLGVIVKDTDPIPGVDVPLPAPVPPPPAVGPEPLPPASEDADEDTEAEPEPPKRRPRRTYHRRDLTADE
jgi:hypothetical protein